MNVVREIQRINQLELDNNVPESGSWHEKYKDSAYVFIGGLDYDLTEGDLITIMSQFGEIVDCNLARDKEKGTSKGFAFIAYEDQRSTVLAVDNMNGAKLFDRTLRCDHVLEYRKPRKKKVGDDQDEKDQGGYESDETYEQRRKRIWDYEKYRAQAIPARATVTEVKNEENQAEKARTSKIMAILEAKRRKWRAKRLAAAESVDGYTVRGGVANKSSWGGDDLAPQLSAGMRAKDRGRTRSISRERRKKDKVNSNLI
eukprot:1152944-Amorphochlora_amoeboformis.AAC.2